MNKGNEMTEAEKQAKFLEADYGYEIPAAIELRRLHHNNEVLLNALWKSCGDDEETVKAYIESQGDLR